MNKYLLAPWRSKYIRSLANPKDDNCIFCDAVNEPDAPVLKKGKKCFVILNIFPYNTGHIMVAPYRHIGDFNKLTAIELNEMMQLAKESTEKIKKLMNPHGFNIGMNIGKIAGAGFADHLHLHVVPRWNGDDNFMSVVGKTKVVSIDTKEIFKLLKKEYKNPASSK